MKQYPLGFSRWLFRKKGESTPIGDLVGDAIMDTSWPIRARKFSEFYKYMKSVNACSEALDALIEAWSLYRGMDYVRIFKNVFYEESDDLDILHIASYHSRAAQGKTYIYFLLDDWKPLYVGQSVIPATRLRQHIFKPGNAIQQKVTTMLEWGRAPLMQVIDCVPIEKGTAYEKSYIEVLEAAAFAHLLNINLVTR